jgi:hypothetical protein
MVEPTIVLAAAQGEQLITETAAAETDQALMVEQAVQA